MCCCYIVSFFVAVCVIVVVRCISGVRCFFCFLFFLPMFRMFRALLFCLQPLHWLCCCLLSCFFVAFGVCVFAFAVYSSGIVAVFNCIICAFVLGVLFLCLRSCCCLVGSCV